MTKEKFFGTPVLAGGREELYRAAAAALYRGGRIATVNPEMLEAARTDAAFSDLLSDFLCLPDGCGVTLAMKRRGVYSDTLPGVDLASRLLSSGALSVGLLGGVPGVAEHAMHRLQKRNPDLTAAFLFDGYTFLEEEVRAALRKTTPDVLLVALGTPRQEKLIGCMAKESPRTLCIGVGGALDVFAGRVRRAPEHVRRLHLEWLWRAVRQPRRFLRFPAIFRFLYYAEREKWTKRKEKAPTF